MAETGRHDRHRNSGVEHLGGHEVTQVVESEMREAGGPSHLYEPLRHEVRQPWTLAPSVSTEDEVIFESPFSSTEALPVAFEQLHAGRVESDPVGATSLRGHEERPVGAFD